jgi:hypothetical protein
VRATIANGMFAAGAFGVPAIVDDVIAFDPKETPRVRQAATSSTPTVVFDTPSALGHSDGQMLCRVVSPSVLVPRPAVATGAGIELILVIPR